MGVLCQNTEIDRMRSYSNIFSRSVFMNIMKFHSFSTINLIGHTYDAEFLSSGNITYREYLTHIYRELLKNYRCEYIYKNLIINSLISKYKTKDTVVLNEFKVGDSVADIALFNGKSRVYEIKTDLDTPKRLSSQLRDYMRFFQECYVVIPENLYDEYNTFLDERVGIIALCGNGLRTCLKTKRSAIVNTDVDLEVLRKTLWISEYEAIVQSYFSELPDVGYYEMYDACYEKISQIPSKALSSIVTEVIKKRKNYTLALRNYDKSLRQICLALKISPSQYDDLFESLNKVISI